jgi:plastocyanin
MVLMSAALLGCEPREQEVRLAAQDFRFSPGTIHVRADAPVLFTIVNEGREPHEFASPLLTDARVRLLAAPESLRVPPGRSITVHFHAPPGIYPFKCRVQGHPGMDGTVIVES